MLTLKPYTMFSTDAVWFQVVDQAGWSFGAMPTKAAAERYKARLEAAGFHSAADRINRENDPVRRSFLRSLMKPDSSERP